MTREELIAYDRWLTENKWGSSEIITPEQAADLYLAKHPLPPAEGAEAILKKENKKCVCGAELKHRGGFEFWCDNPHCKTAYVLDADGHISESGTVGRKVEQQPTAEGAEEILDDIAARIDSSVLSDNRDMIKEFYRNKLNTLATLHAQRIADKMVSERLREDGIATKGLLRDISRWGEHLLYPMSHEAMINLETIIKRKYIICGRVNKEKK